MRYTGSGYEVLSLLIHFTHRLEKKIFREICCLHFQILSMIEEAAGTRLYETKKEAAQKTIEKKDAKLREIDSVIIFLK